MLSARGLSCVIKLIGLDVKRKSCLTTSVQALMNCHGRRVVMVDTRNSNHANENETIMMGQSRIFNLPRSGIVMTERQKKGG